MQDIKKKLDNLYHDKIIDGDKAPDTIIPKNKCEGRSVIAGNFYYNINDAF